MKKKLRFLVFFITALTVCSHGSSTVFSISPENDIHLAETPDAGIDYQNSLVFFGESTTTHLKSRGVLKDGKKTEQVWANKSGTMLLSPKIISQRIIDPKTGEHLTVEQAAKREQPAYMILSFGLNGIVGFAKNKNAYLESYQKLIDAIQKASPKTAIILQTVYPVTSPVNASDWHFSESVEEVNRMIELVNGYLPALAEANTGVKIADTASILKDANGMLRREYATEDGIHLTEAAYTQILSYLRTHAYHIPTPLPITKDQWREHA